MTRSIVDRTVVAALCAVLSFVAGPCVAETFATASAEARALIEAASIFGPYPRLIAKIEMRMFPADGGAAKTRELEISIQRSGGRIFTLARVTSPAFLGDMKFLKRMEPGKADAQWVKTSRGVRRLAADRRYESLFDSQFTSEDFGSVDGSGYELSLVPDRDDAASRVVAAKPTDSAPYARRLIRLARDSGLVTAMEYLDASGKALKRFSVIEVEGSGRDARPVELRMDDLVSGASTRLRVIALATPSSIPERVFNPLSL